MFDMATLQDKMASMIGGAEKPEVVQRHIEFFLSTIDEVVNLSDEDWIEIMEDIKDEVEFDEASWRDKE